VAQIYKEAFNIELPRRVSQQKKLGRTVKGSLQPGDVVFFKITDSVSHVGIYLYNKKFVHAASSGPKIGVIKSSLNEKYYKTKYVFAKRFIDLPKFGEKKTEEKKTQKKPAEKKENKIEIKKKYNDELLIGKEVYKGKLFNLSKKFEINESIYIMLSINDKHKNVVMLISNENVNKKVEIKVPVYKKIFQIINLKKGTYNIQIIDESQKIIFNEKFLVK
jgi:hypothetical protein